MEKYGKRGVVVKELMGRCWKGWRIGEGVEGKIREVTVSKGGELT